MASYGDFEMKLLIGIGRLPVEARGITSKQKCGFKESEQLEF